MMTREQYYQKKLLEALRESWQGSLEFCDYVVETMEILEKEK